MVILLKGIIEKLFKPEQKPTQSEVPTISHEDVEALIDAKLKEHTAAIETSIKENTQIEQNQEDNKLTAKQVDYALSLIAKLNGEYVLAAEPSDLTLKDLNRLIGYNRYKNKGILVNLAKKGVLKKG
ncbi:ABC transporter ATP-binding protein [Neobacillus sp. PS3-12]|nr:ABC transporter ATP-binding protein [Neobacillus sp. PS3-12]WML53327.1 ABC transporter ATP-binding protein [Neobacillus sp. PS3-12]